MIQASGKRRWGSGKPEDLDEELLGKEVEVVLHNGGTLRGRLIASSSYWIKLEFGNKHVHVNKPYIVLIRPLS
jgi:sRNA-binding regulator protein Hfq